MSAIKLAASTTLVEMTLAAFDDPAAETTFKTEIAKLMSGKTMADVTITNKVYWFLLSSYANACTERENTRFPCEGQWF